ncbi:MAG: YCF48-related protein, partial [Bacteroidales bacterium]|nr:YCF48-related protein [Bacteroidales bacterium]
KTVSFSNNTGFAVGMNGTIIKTTDGGDFWVKLTSFTTNTLNGLSFINDSICYIAGNNGKIYKTENAGSDWDSLYNFTNENLNDVFCYENGKCYAVGNNGVIFKSSEDTIWSSQISNTLLPINSIFFLNSDTGYVVGNSGLILRTTDGGTDFVKEIFIDKINVSIFPNPCRGVFYVKILTDIKIESDLLIEIQNLNGQVVLSKRVGCNGDFIMPFNTANYSKGIYIVKLTNSRFVKIEKLLIE